MKNKGFTIIESLVAISILVAVIIGAMSAVQSGIASYIYSKDRTIAFFLAQEAFEQVRNIRDENALKERHWLYGLSQTSSDPCYFGNSCMVSGVTVDVVRCEAVNNCPKIRQDVVTGFYAHNSSWPETQFTRMVTLSQVNEDEIVVSVTVKISGRSIRQFKAQENLFNWQ